MIVFKDKASTLYFRGKKRKTYLKQLQLFRELGSEYSQVPAIVSSLAFSAGLEINDTDEKHRAKTQEFGTYRKVTLNSLPTSVICSLPLQADWTQIRPNILSGLMWIQYI